MLPLFHKQKKKTKETIAKELSFNNEKQPGKEFTTSADRELNY